MNKMNGNQMAVLIREFEVENMLQPVYIVGLSGDNVTSPVFKRRQLGQDSFAFNEFLQKPTGLSQLQNVLAKVFNSCWF